MQVTIVPIVGYVIWIGVGVANGLFVWVLVVDVRVVLGWRLVLVAVVRPGWVTKVWLVSAIVVGVLPVWVLVRAKVLIIAVLVKIVWAPSTEVVRVG